MPVLLRQPGEIPAAGWTHWVGIAGAQAPAVPQDRRLPGLAASLEAAFDAIGPHWLELARALGTEPTAVLAHTPSATPNASDLGLMMAWTTLVRDWAAADTAILVICDDPWMFRHLAAVPGVQAGTAPPLVAIRLKGMLRGLAARLKYAINAARAAIRFRGERSRMPSGACLLCYGHPRSDAAGTDAYFGDLMSRLPHLTRWLHVDAWGERVAALRGDRTASLHGWGHPLFALARLPFARWVPPATHLRGPHGMLVRRAAAKEAATAQGAAVAWQIHCQGRWLKRARPQVVAWPWENHCWERAFVRQARTLGIRTLGYQHSVVGRQMLNYAAGSNPDGAASLPDHILCSGAATRDQLAGWGIPAERLAIGGALRFSTLGAVRHDPAAPVFLALPFDQPTCAEMVAAARATGSRFLVKDHPMTPFAFDDGNGVTRTDLPLGRQPAVSAVVYAATTVGLEAILLGLPTARFQPEGRIALDILPTGIAVPTVTASSMSGILSNLAAIPSPRQDTVFGHVDYRLWHERLRAS